MTDPLILHIETATDICSVALSEGDLQLSLVESGQERSHASLLNSFIRQAIAQAGKELKDLNGIAVSKGPGS
ncbi:MAG: tRNA (adenosine(37)-N6)-threonylcarbamoyltransferase complex dimerization subunit type 1 TsaB, partial [Bacteroidetes bacterium]